MNTKGLVALLLTGTVLFTGCKDKNKDEFIPDEKKPTIEIGSFEDFTYLMYTEKGESILRDSQGNEYTLSSDGYYYDSDGNRIDVYGIGDEATFNLGKSSGATFNSDKDNVNGRDSNSSGNESSTMDSSNSSNITLKEVGDGSDGDILIEDWNSYRNQIMSDAGITESDESTWHNHEDAMEAFTPDKGDSKISANTSYQTNIKIGDSIPATVEINGLQDTGSGLVTGKISLDGNSYSEYVKSVMGDNQLDETNEEVPADYTGLLIGESCEVYMVATDGFNNVVSDTSTVVFDENYSGEFSVSCDIPDGYTTYLVINGVRYNI